MTAIKIAAMSACLIISTGIASTVHAGNSPHETVAGWTYVNGTKHCFNIYRVSIPCK